MYLSAWEANQTDFEQNLLDFDISLIEKRERSSSFVDLLSSSTCSNIDDFSFDPFDFECKSQPKEPSFNSSLSPHIIDDYVNVEVPKLPIAFQILVPTTMKRIGTLSPEERKLKILRYQEKKKRRQWGKKISYDCRKRVADRRIRVKGRFIGKTQAAPMTNSD
ncbi:unnamed protein product [Blepharisma stoltei]|uniref:CCT domain-containing protein n=1 Tax=Blepharisma stoltei TaxID=1481888 RepID=A0AAU9ILZ2_9CILI|nr:unnamed protein product [Blepharisma stoltei]